MKTASPTLKEKFFNVRVSGFQWFSMFKCQDNSGMAFPFPIEIF